MIRTHPFFSGLFRIGALIAAVALFGCDRLKSQWDEVKFSAEHCERLAREVGLSAEQKQSAMDLLAAYHFQHAAALDKMEHYRKVYSELTKDGESPEQKAHYDETNARYERHCRQLRDTLIADLASLLTPEQAARWPRFERWYRREQLLPQGTLHGESVDVERLVESLTPSVPIEGALASALDEYSVEIDAALVARQETLNRAPPKNDGSMPPEALARALEAFIDDQHQARLRVRRVNFAFAERVAGLLGEEARAAFQSAFDASAFPEVFNRDFADGAFDEVLKLADLSAEQRAAIETIRSEYFAALPEANRRWAEGIRRDEEQRTARTLLARTQAGAPGQPGDEARAARNELDERTRRRVIASLTPDQRRRLSWINTAASLPRVEF